MDRRLPGEPLPPHVTFWDSVYGDGWPHDKGEVRGPRTRESFEAAAKWPTVDAREYLHKRFYGGDGEKACDAHYQSILLLNPDGTVRSTCPRLNKPGFRLVEGFGLRARCNMLVIEADNEPCKKAKIPSPRAWFDDQMDLLRRIPASLFEALNIHSTRHGWRAIAWLDHPIHPAEFEKLTQQFMAVVSQATGIKLDPACERGCSLPYRAPYVRRRIGDSGPWENQEPFYVAMPFNVPLPIDAIPKVRTSNAARQARTAVAQADRPRRERTRSPDRPLAGIEDSRATRERKEWVVPERICEGGGRNDWMAKTVGKLRGAGFNEEEIRPLAHWLDQKICDPPLGEECDRVVDSISGRNMGGRARPPIGGKIEDWLRGRALVLVSVGVAGAGSEFVRLKALIGLNARWGGLVPPEGVAAMALDPGAAAGSSHDVRRDEVCATLVDRLRAAMRRNS